jgi:hypothetical protein
MRRGPREAQAYGDVAIRWTGGFTGTGGLRGFTGVYGGLGLRGQDTNCTISRSAVCATLPPVYGDRIRIAQFPDPQSAPHFLDWSRRAPLRRTPSRRPHGSMNFRSFAAVNGLRPPEAARAVGRRKTPVFRRAMGRRETPVFRRAMSAPLTASKLRKKEASIGRMLRIRLTWGCSCQGRCDSSIHEIAPSPFRHPWSEPVCTIWSFAHQINLTFGRRGTRLHQDPACGG